MRALLAAAAVVALVHVLQGRQSGPLLVQGIKNLNFARRPLDAALESHGWLRPPLYPLVLWGASRAGLPPRHVNEMLFLLTLGLVAVYARRQLRGIAPLWPVLLLAVAHFNHANVYQPVAETLFVLLLLTLVLALQGYQERAVGRCLVLSTGALAGLALARYFALVFPLPAAALNLALLPPLPWRRRLRNAAIALTVAGIPIAFWMGLAGGATGFLTGDDRWAPRDLPAEVAHWSKDTGLADHARLTAKTLVIDFFCPRQHAGLAVVTRPHPQGRVEWAGLVLVLAAGVVLALQLGQGALPRTALDRVAVARSGGALLVELVVFFYATTLAVWTFANNDPIHTRFLYPSYALLVLLGFHAYAWVMARAREPACAVPFVGLYLLVGAVQLWRSVQAAPLPIR